MTQSLTVGCHGMARSASHSVFILSSGQIWKIDAKGFANICGKERVGSIRREVKPALDILDTFVWSKT